MNIDIKTKKIILAQSLLKNVLEFSKLEDIYRIYGGEKDFLKHLGEVSYEFEMLLNKITQTNNGDEEKTMDDFEELNVIILKELLLEIMEEEN